MAPASVSFRLDLRDAPGGDFGKLYDGAVDPATNSEGIDSLLTADGLIYLFDPATASADGGSIDYFSDALIALKRRGLNGGIDSDGYLKKHLAVCVTKLDDNEVFRRAAKAGLIYSDKGGNVRVPDHLAEEFFALLCRARDMERAEKILDDIKSSFRSPRYFVASSIGFSAESQRDDGQAGPLIYCDPNVEDDGDGKVVRPPAHPINVLEPVLYLFRQVQRDRPGSSGASARAGSGPGHDRDRRT